LIVRHFAAHAAPAALVTTGRAAAHTAVVSTRPDSGSQGARGARKTANKQGGPSPANRTLLANSATIDPQAP
jgi:methionine-rich copper-binding protein CopC